MQKLISQLVSTSTLLLCLACMNTETVFEQLAGECAEEIDQSLLPRVHLEIDALETYFVEAGLLRDRSGASIYRVYQQIARDGDLQFAVETRFPLLDSVPPPVLARCYPLALETPTASPTLLRYLRTVYEMEDLRSGGDITPGIVAQEIVDHLRPEDFEHGFLRVSALITFYVTATPVALLQKRRFQPPDSVQWAVFSLSADNTLLHNDQSISLDQVSPHLRTFVEVDPPHRGVRMITRRETSYEFYINVYDSVKQVYRELREQEAQDRYQSPLDDLSESQRKIVEKKIPTYISVPPPEN